MKRELSKK